MSLYTVAQAEPWFILASNLDSSTTEEAHKAGLTASSTAYGTITQNASSLTGNASYDFSSNGRVLHQWSGQNNTNSFILEGVFKKSSVPGSDVTLLATPGSVQGSGTIKINTSGQLVGRFSNAFSQTITATSTANYCDNKWHHVVFAYSRGTQTLTICRLYVDGVLVASNTSSISDSSWGYQRILNIGSALNTAGTASEYFNGTIDFAAFYIQGTSGTTTQQQTDHIAALDAFVASHAASYADKTVAADPSTASALAIQPALILDKIIAADPATASAEFAEALQNDIDLPIMVNAYMESLNNAGKLEQWYKFDKYKIITNYGNGGSSGYGFYGNSHSINQGGFQGSGCIKFTGSYQDGNISASGTSLAAFVPEISDGDWVIGFWIKIPTGYPTNGNIFNAADATGKYVGFNQNGNTTNVVIRSSSGDHVVASTGNIADNNWHFVAGKFSSGVLELFIDNVSQGTTTVNGTLMTTVTNAGFGSNNIPPITGTPYFSLSQFFAGTSANITNTVLSNIYNAGSASIQAAAELPMVAFSNNNAFNDYALGLNPYFYYKLDESSGNPQSVGQSNISLTIDGTNLVQNVTTKNYKGVQFNNRDSGFGGVWTAPSGTFTSNQKQTLAIYARATANNNLNHLGGTGAFGNSPGASALGVGIGMLFNGSNFLCRIFNAGGQFETITDTTNYLDGQYHLFVGVKNGNSFSLYVDGKLKQTITSNYNLTDNGLMTIGAVAGVALTNVARDLTVDDFIVFPDALNTQQIFELYRSLTETMDTTASSSLPMPAYQAGFGPTVSVDVMTASASLPNVFPFVSPATANGLFQMPNFLAQQVVSVAADVMTASAQGENPGWNIGEDNQVLHMNASATFPEPLLLIPGFWFDNPKIATAEMVQPAIVTTLGALIKPQSFNASSFLPLPPAYFTIADDLWYQRLVEIDQKSPTVAGTITFFNTSDNLYVNGSYGGWSATSSNNQITSPLPAAYGGYFDGQNRKALNLRNIILTTGGPGAFGEGDRDFTFEAMIKTTKSNQVLFVGENESIYNFQRTGIVLKDGKLGLTYSKDRVLGRISTADTLAFTGFKNIADGEWHHIIIQNRQTGIDSGGARIQFWIDGKLDIQKYGNEMYVINQIGYNSPDINSYSDFTLSVAALNKSSMVEENEINLNYLAAFNIIPVKAPVATATATATPNTKGRGNRGRALMLYFWPTQNASIGYYTPPTGNPFVPYGNNFHYYDQGGYGNNPDTFYQLTTYTTNGANKFYDWDIWPVSVTGLESGDTWTGESHPILKDGIFKSGTDKGTVYVDPVTDNERYLNLMTDLKDLSQFDMICFRNYPDQSNEQDKYGVNAKGVVDEYFNLLDKNLFADFLKSLREAVDTGISLLITNPQLAVDMGFIDTYHVVPDLTDAGNEDPSDPYVPMKLDDPYGDGSETYTYSTAYKTSLNSSDGNYFKDAYRNNYHEVVNTLEDLTDDAAFIWTDEIAYIADQSEFGELDRKWSHIEYNNGLQIGDRFLISTAPNYNQSYFAAPISAVKAGKVITKFADTYYHGSVERVNPYRNYATTIAVEPGTVVAGKQIGAKVFISFTDVVGIQTRTGGGSPIEERVVSLNTPYWISYAYSAGLITDDERDRYLDEINAQPVDWTQLTSKDTRYWTLDGSEIIGSTSYFGENDAILADTSEAVKGKKTLARTRRGKRKTVGGSTGSIPNFSITWGWLYPQISVSIPSINTRALWWLSDRLEYAGGLPQRPEAFNADGFMPQPTISGYKTATVAAQSAVASARIVETNLRSPDAAISALPLTAIAFFPERGTIIGAEVATATARAPQDIRTTTLESDQVVLYIVHVDPILYLREEVIK